MKVFEDCESAEHGEQSGSNWGQNFLCPQFHFYFYKDSLFVISLNSPATMSAATAAASMSAMGAT